MVLLIPQELKTDINKHSGYLNYDSKYGKKTFKYLFLSDINEKFLSNQVYRLLLNQKYINSVNSQTEYYTNTNNFNEIIPFFKKNKPFIYECTRSFMENFNLPYYEDVINKNPIDILSNINTEFILLTSKNLIQNPQNLNENYLDINPDTGKEDINFKGFGATSYSTGYWQPEKLFTDSKRNRENPYWIPRESSYTIKPPNGPFHPRETYYKYNNKEHMDNNIFNNYDVIDPVTGENYTKHHNYVDANDYGYDTLEQTLLSKDPINVEYTDYVYKDSFTDIDALGPGPGNKYMYDYYGDYTNPNINKRGFSSGGVFPRWQYSMNTRHYSRTSEGLREAGEGDRRRNFTRKYDMSSLVNKSNY